MFGQSLYNESAYNEASSNVAFFLARLVESLPPAYRPQDYQGLAVRDFIERLLLPSAEGLDRVNAIIDQLHEFVSPDASPEEWLRWMLTEWLGWTLIPDGYPVNRLRRLLANLHLHYKQRYTKKGVKDLLAEFGVISEVYDRKLYTGGYLGRYGSQHSPLHVRVRVLRYEPFFFPKRVYLGGFFGNIHLYRTRKIITEDFVMDLIRWSRAAGVEYLVEFVTGSFRIVE